MIKKTNENLAKYTTVKIGGDAATLYIPESVDELAGLIREKGMLPLISGGSNLLINDEKVFPEVIYMGKTDESIRSLGDGRYYVGASVRLQKLINTVNADGYGGMEYLFSVPGMLGGSVYMNAGRGSDKKCISDHILDVHVLDEKGEMQVLAKESCAFAYRKSLFQSSFYVIVGATMRFEPQAPEVSRGLIAERLAQCKSYQDNKKPNFGSVFCLYNPRIMRTVQKYGHKLCRKGSAHFSEKTVNWIVNDGNGSYKQAKRSISLAARLHKLFGKPCKIEVRIWE